MPRGGKKKENFVEPNGGRKSAVSKEGGEIRRKKGILKLRGDKEPRGKGKRKKCFVLFPGQRTREGFFKWGGGGRGGQPCAEPQSKGKGTGKKNEPPTGHEEKGEGQNRSFTDGVWEREKEPRKQG